MIAEMMVGANWATAKTAPMHTAVQPITVGDLYQARGGGFAGARFAGAGFASAGFAGAGFAGAGFAGAGFAGCAGAALGGIVVFNVAVDLSDKDS